SPFCDRPGGDDSAPCNADPVPPGRGCTRRDGSRVGVGKDCRHAGVCRAEGSVVQLKEGLLRRVIAVIGTAVTFATVGPSLAVAGAGNPSGTGPPSRSCQDQLTNGGITPGNAASSPGSPFNEPGFGSANGGTGGANY